MTPSKKLIVVAALAIAIAGPTARAQKSPDKPPEYELDYAGEQLPFGYVRSIDAFAGPNATANSLGLAAEYATMMKNYNQAILLNQRAMKKNGDDIDIHKAYAEALEGKLEQERKLHKDADDDPMLYNACVYEWLVVYKNLVGEEKGLNKKNGAGVAKFNKLYEDEERVLVAKQHIQALTGTLPKAKETNEKFMARARMEAEMKVSAKLLQSRPKEEAAAPTLWMK